MYLVLFAVGLLITAAGLLTIGFGIPINAFSLGNTLIVSGTVAVVGGLVLIGLAAAIRQLARIAAALNSRPVQRPVAAAPAAAQAPVQAPAQAVVQAPVLAPVHAPAPEIAESLVPPTARIPQVAVRTPAKPPEQRPEPRFPVNEPSSSPLDWLRSKPKGDAPSEPPVMDVADEAPLSPRPPQRQVLSPPPAAPSPSIEPPAEPKSWLPGRNGAPEHKEPTFPPMTSPRSERVARTSPSVEPQREPGRGAGKDAGLFDVVWPDARSKPMPGAEPAPREPKFEQRPEPAPRAREEKRAEPAPTGSAILKSGVIDGMAYTLYADGSIEAELPQGTVRFASVDALRAHLEKSV